MRESKVNFNFWNKRLVILLSIWSHGDLSRGFLAFVLFNKADEIEEESFPFKITNGY